MLIRSIAVLVLFVWGGFHTTQAQPSSTPAKERSHVERFSSPEVRAGRDEADANAKLATNPNDDQALNARARANPSTEAISQPSPPRINDPISTAAKYEGCLAVTPVCMNNKAASDTIFVATP